MRQVSVSICLLAVIFATTSCAISRGVIPLSNGSITELREADYQVVRTNLRGEASCPYLFGLIPLGDPSIATRAMDELVNSADVSGKPIGLVNFAGDEVAAWYVVVTVRTVVIRADAVQFSEN